MFIVQLKYIYILIIFEFLFSNSILIQKTCDSGEHPSLLQAGCGSYSFTPAGKMPHRDTNSKEHFQNN